MRILMTALCLSLLVSCNSVNRQGMMPEEHRSGASDEEVIIMVAGAILIDFCVVFALCHDRHR